MFSDRWEKTREHGKWRDSRGSSASLPFFPSSHQCFSPEANRRSAFLLTLQLCTLAFPTLSRYSNRGEIGESEETGTFPALALSSLSAISLTPIAPIDLWVCPGDKLSPFYRWELSRNTHIARVKHFQVEPNRFLAAAILRKYGSSAPVYRFYCWTLWVFEEQFHDLTPRVKQAAMTKKQYSRNRKNGRIICFRTFRADFIEEISSPLSPNRKLSLQCSRSLINLSVVRYARAITCWWAGRNDAKLIRVCTRECAPLSGQGQYPSYPCIPVSLSTLLALRGWYSLIVAQLCFTKRAKASAIADY